MSDWHRWVAMLEHDGWGTDLTFGVFTHEQRAEWRYMPAVYRAQFGADIEWWAGDDDPEDVPLGHTWRPVEGEWTTDEEWDAVPDWWPHGEPEELTAGIDVDWTTPSRKELRLLASFENVATLRPSTHDEVLVACFREAEAQGHVARAEVDLRRGARGCADLLIDCGVAVEVKGRRSEIPHGRQQVKALTDLLGGVWTPVVVVPDDQAPRKDASNQEVAVLTVSEFPDALRALARKEVAA